MFAESNTRWLFEVKKGREAEFKSIMAGLDLYEIGRVSENSLRVSEGGKTIIDEPIDRIRDAWTKPLWNMMG